MFKLLSRRQIIEIAQLLTAVMLLVVGRRITLSFGNRKSVFIVKNNKKWVFSGIFDFSKK